MFGIEAAPQGLLIDTSALAAVALVGYLFGRRTRRKGGKPKDPKLDEQLARAQRIADDLRSVVSQIDVENAAHRRSLSAMQAHLDGMQQGTAAADWPKLRESADRLLSPTLRLATDLTVASDRLQKLHSQLTAFSGSRIDAATGLRNRRSLDEQLGACFSIHSNANRPFALALFSIDSGVSGEDADGEVGDDLLRLVAALLTEQVRDDDFVARYSQDEFVVLMPRTSLEGALAFSERIMARAGRDVGCQLWGGVVEATSVDTPDKLLSRADSALYSARATREASLFFHNGVGLRRRAVAVDQHEWPPLAVEDGQPEPAVS